jgi:Ca-activated chloride channel family protein
MPSVLPGFSHPWYLLLLALLPLIYLIERRSRVMLPRWRRVASLGLRTLVILLIVLAISGLQLRRRSDELCVIFAVDRSNSIEEHQAEDVLEKIRGAVSGMRARDKAALVLFAEEAYVDVAPSMKPSIQRFEAIPPRHHTDIARAIRLALGLFPDDAQKRLVIFSDGNENLEHAMVEARTCAANDVAIDVYPLVTAEKPEIIAEKLSVPETANKAEPFEIRTTIDSNVDAAATLRFFRDEHYVGSEKATLTSGKNVFSFPASETESGLHSYKVLVESSLDNISDNNIVESFTFVYGEPHYLVVGSEEDAQFLVEALKQEGLLVEAAPSPPLSLAQLENFDAFILTNISAERLSNQQLRFIQQYVEDFGGGFAMVGGENAFGVGGYVGTPVETILPVNMEIKNRKQFPSLALVMVIDKSGSMGGVEGVTMKMDLANDAAARAVDLLSPLDKVGVIAFDSSCKWVQSIADAKAKDAIKNNIRSIRPGGGTDMYPALSQAFDALAQTPAQLKHIIVLSDGMTAPADFPSLIGNIVGAKITLSSVAIGVDADQQLMRFLAEQGRGRYYFTDDPYNIPRIFTRETILAQRSYIVEKEFVPQLYQENQIVKGIADEGFPSLLGYVLTEPKDRAELVLRTDKEEPLLAVWRFGLGKTAAFTSDAKNRWASHWLGWTGYKKFFAQLAQWIQRSRKPSVLRPTLTIDEGRGKITVDALTPEGETVNFLNLQAKVSTPNSEMVSTSLQQVAPGRYEGEFDAREVGAYLVSVAGESVEPATTGGVVPYSPEYREFKTNAYLLSQITSLTGGRINPPLETLFEARDTRVRTSRDVWYALVIAALILFVLDIAVRRIFIERKQLEAALAVLEKLTARLTPVRERLPAPVEETLAALKKRKETVARVIRQPASPVTLPADARTAEPSAPAPETPPSEKAKTQEPAPEKSQETETKQAEELHTTRLLKFRDRLRKEKPQ